MILDENSPRPEIQYPCEWAYKIIGTDVNLILTAIEESALGMKYDVSPSNISRKGNYFSLNLKLEVPNEVIRNLIYEKLEKQPGIKMVL